MTTTDLATTLEPAALAAAVERAWEDFLLADRTTPTPHPDRVYASAYRTCERRMVLELTAPDQQAPFDAFTLAKFRRGDDRERDLLADLQRIGRNADPTFRIVGQQERFNVHGRRRPKVLTGKVDAFLELDAPRDWRAPLEVKAWSPNLTDRIDTFADVFENPWTRAGGYQLLSYLYGHALPVGFLVLDRSGLPKLLPVVLEQHYDRVEEFLARAERVVEHAQAGTLPPFLEGDAAECKRCPFYGRVCNPPLVAGDFHVFSDPDLEAELDRWHELKPAGQEWQSLDKRIKARLRGVENGVAGPFAIIGKWSNYSRVELPDALKKEYTVVDPKGRFSLDIEKMPAIEGEASRPANVIPFAAPASEGA